MKKILQIVSNVQLSKQAVFILDKYNPEVHCMHIFGV